MSQSIFARIISGELPCHEVYQDELVLAFLDIGPLSRGHTLVIPKRPAETLDQLDEASSAAIGRVLPRLCRAVQRATGAGSYNVLQNNGAEAHQAVPHVHFHIIPRFRGHDDGAGLELREVWQPVAFSHEAGAELAREIAAQLEPAVK